MRIIVTGGCGFIGSNLVRLLLHRGHQVMNIDKLTYAGNMASVRAIEGSTSYRFQQADICDSGSMEEAMASFRPNAVMHLAAESHVDRSIDGPMDFVQTNVVGTVTLLQAALSYWLSLDKSKSEKFRFLHG